MADYSWIEPSTKNIANLFGLNPEAAAKGRAMQSEQEYNAARTANTQADTGLSPYRRALLEAQAGKYGADAGKTTAEAANLNYGLEGRKSVARAFLNGLTRNQDGSMTLSPESANLAMSGFAAFANNPEQVAEAARSFSATASTNPRFAAQTRGIAGSFRPDAAFTAKEGQDIQGSKAAASQAEAIAVQKERNKGSLAEAFQKAGLPGSANAQANVDQMNLNRQSDAITAGAEWVMKVPIQGGFLDEGQAYQLSQAARAANPSLNPQDAITKFVRDNPSMFKGNWEMFGKNKVDIQGGIPATVPAAPAVRAPVANGFKGAPSMSMATDNQQPVAQAPVAPSGMPTKSQFAALPEGGSVVVNGVKYVKQGRQLVPAQ